MSANSKPLSSAAAAWRTRSRGGCSSLDSAYPIRGVVGFDLAVFDPRAAMAILPPHMPSDTRSKCGDQAEHHDHPPDQDKGQIGPDDRLADLLFVLSANLLRVDGSRITHRPTLASSASSLA